MAQNQKVIDRINEIIQKVSEENMGGRSARYIGSGLKKQKQIPSKRSLYSHQPGGGKLNEGSYIMYDEDTGNNYFETVGEGGNMVAGNMVAGAGRIGFPTGGAGARSNRLGKPKRKLEADDEFDVNLRYVKTEPVKRRKKRKDTGKPRNTEWTQFVKEVAASYAIPYNKALTVASQLKKQGTTIEDL